MKRAMRRSLRNNTPVTMAEVDPTYIPRHAKLVEFVEEILAELCDALDITAEFMAEVAETVAGKTAEYIRKAAEKIHLRTFPVYVMRNSAVLEFLRNGGVGNAILYRKA